MTIWSASILHGAHDARSFMPVAWQGKAMRTRSDGSNRQTWSLAIGTAGMSGCGSDCAAIAAVSLKGAAGFTTSRLFRALLNCFAASVLPLAATGEEVSVCMAVQSGQARIFQATERTAKVQAWSAW